MIPLTVGSLFSGIGGFEFGLERTGGFKTVWQCEIDPFCLKVLAKHWPDVKRFTDIKRMGVDEEIPCVDVICGGFPCQDISCAGKGAGIHAERSGLWWEMHRIIRMVRPRYVLVENVAALLNRGLDEVLGSLAESGYDAEWTILRACDFGLPHRRERIYLIAYSGRLRPNTGWTKQPLSGTGADGKEGITTNPAGIRRGGILRQRRKAESFRVKGDGDTWDASNAMRPGLSQPKQERELRRSITQCNWGQAPSPICRVDDVIPYRMDRLRALGNAIVPQCAQFVGQCLLDSIRTEATQ